MKFLRWFESVDRRHFARLFFLLFLLAAVSSCGGGGGENGVGGTAPLVTTLPADAVTDNSAFLHGSVNPNGGQTNAWFEWGIDNNSLINRTTEQPVGGSNTLQSLNELLTSLAPATKYYFRAAASNSFGVRRGTIENFTTPLLSPVVETLAASPVGENFAQVNGNVDPRGRETQARFEWGTDPGLKAAAKTALQTVGSGNGPVPITEVIPGLSSGTTYYYRVFAINDLGVSQTGAILHFTTSNSPEVITQPATGVQDTSADLHGIVDPNGVQTLAWFEWGPDPSLSTPNLSPEQDVGSGTGAVPVSVPLSGLDTGTTYYFRVAARPASGGTVKRGGIENLTTSGLQMLDVYVAFGDSITYGFKDDFLGDDTSLDGRNTGGGFEPVLNDLLTAALGYPHSVLNEGFGGYKASQGLEELDNVLASHTDAKYYLVLFGTNDAYGSNPTASGLGLVPGDPGYAGSYKDSMQQIIDRILAEDMKPYLAKIPQPLKAGYSDSLVKEYNEVIDELVAANGILVVPPDLYYGLNHQTDFDADQLHPNGVGYQEIAALWLNSLVPP